MQTNAFATNLEGLRRDAVYEFYECMEDGK